MSKLRTGAPVNDKNYYEILGIAPHVGSGQIQAAYRFARGLYTGESTPTYGLLDSEERGRMLALVEEAYAALSNPSVRRDYDLRMQSPPGEAPVSDPPTRPRLPVAAPAVRTPMPPLPTHSPDAPPPPRIPDIVSGHTLRQLREACGLSIEQIAALSKVGSRFLQALEEDRHEALPGRVFARGFLIEYARALRVSETDLVERYLRHWAGK